MYYSVEKNNIIKSTYIHIKKERHTETRAHRFHTHTLCSQVKTETMTEKQLEALYSIFGLTGTTCIRCGHEHVLHIRLGAKLRHDPQRSCQTSGCLCPHFVSLTQAYDLLERIGEALRHGQPQALASRPLTISLGNDP